MDAGYDLVRTILHQLSGVKADLRRKKIMLSLYYTRLAVLREKGQDTETVEELISTTESSRNADIALIFKLRAALADQPLPARRTAREVIEEIAAYCRLPEADVLVIKERQEEIPNWIVTSNISNDETQARCTEVTQALANTDPLVDWQIVPRGKWQSKRSLEFRGKNRIIHAHT